MRQHLKQSIQQSLSWLERTLKTDARYLMKGVSLLGVGQAFAAISGLILTVGLVRLLDQAHYGQYTYILALAGIVSAFTLSGMDTAVAQAIARGHKQTLLHGFWTKLRWGLPPGIVTILVGVYYLVQENSTLGLSLVIIGIFSPLLYATSLYGAYFNGTKEFKKLAIDNAVRNLIITISILTTAFLTQSVVYVILAYFLSNTLISSIRFLLLARTIQTEHDTTHAESLSLGKHLSFMDLLSNISLYIDKILVFQLLGATPLAFYALALAPVKQLQSISKIVRVLVLPKFSTRTPQELKASMQRKIGIFYLVSFAVVVTYCIVAQLFFIKIFPEYARALVMSQALSVGLLFMPCILHLQALSALGKKRELYIFNITKFITKIVTLVTLVPFYGIWGAIGSFVLTHAVIAGSLAYLFAKAKFEEI